MQSCALAKRFIMEIPFSKFVTTARWLSAAAAVAYHVRFLTLVEYEALSDPGAIEQLFYFLTGLGHEAFAVFLVCEGIAAGQALSAHAARASHRGVGRGFSCYIAALATGGLLDLVGSAYFNHTGHYLDYPAFSTLTLTIPALLGNALMLQPFAVPTFGSNGMLYLASYLFWARCLVALYLAASRLPMPWRRTARVLLVLAIVALMPDQFHAWMAIWLSGLALAMVAPRLRHRPPMLIGMLVLLGGAVVSRWIGAHDELLPAPFGQLLIGWRYLIAALGFVVLALAVAPRGRWQEQHDNLAHPRFQFFFHFPTMMLLCGIATDVAGQRLMGQPALSSYLFFGGLTLATIAVSLAISACLRGIVGDRLRLRPSKMQT